MTHIDIAALVADLKGPIPVIEGLSGPYPDETAIRDTADQAVAALIAQDAELKRLTARAEAAEALLANAGAVMVEAALRLPAYDSDGDPAGQFDHHVFVRRDDLRALSTLSPIAAAAGVLLADPDTFDGFNGYILNRHDMDATMSDYAEGAMDYLRAIAEQEKADG